MTNVISYAFADSAVHNISISLDRVAEKIGVEVEDDGRPFDPLIAPAAAVETDLAIQYLESHREHPFFLAVSWNPPHNPYTPPPKFDVYDPGAIPLRPNVPEDLRATARESLAGYYGLIDAVDANVGRILEALEASGGDG